MDDNLSPRPKWPGEDVTVGRSRSGGYDPLPRQARFQAEERLDTQLLLRRLAKRKFQILVVALIVVIPALVASYLSGPLFRSAALIQVNLGTVRVLPYRDMADSGDGTPSAESLLRAQEQILQSPTLIDRVARRLESESKEEGAKREASRLNERLGVRRVPESQLFEISYLAPSPLLAATVANLVVEEYMKRDLEVRQVAREKARQALQRELQGLEERIQLSEKELVQYAQDHKILNLEPGQTDPLQNKLALLDQLVVNSEVELIAAKSRLDSIQKVSLQDLPEALVTPLVQNLTSQLLGLEHDLTTLRASFGENWPAVVQKRNEIAIVRQQLEHEKGSILAQRRQQTQLDLQSVENKHRILSTSRGEQRRLQEQIQQASIQYNILRREAETNRRLYEALLERFKQSGVMAGFEFGNIHVIEPGRPDNRVASPKILWNLSLASLFGLALGVCFALVKDFWDDSISTIEEAEQLVGLPGLGCVPLLKPSKSHYLAEMARGSGRSELSTGRRLLDPTLPATPDGQLTQDVKEQVRNICASILLSRSEHVPRIIAFTSAKPMEGKTTLVSQVGRAFAENGSRTLLVEADLRKPDLSKIYGAGHEEGLSLFLSGLVSPMPKAHRTEHPNLHIVASGPPAPNPVALLNSERMQAFLKEASSSFQFVLLDCPPLLAFADPRILCSRADGVVLVVRAGDTKRNLLRRARALLEDARVTLLGLVLNGADPQDAGSGYYGYYRVAGR